jgi:hypothetical protein
MSHKEHGSTEEERIAGAARTAKCRSKMSEERMKEANEKATLGMQKVNKRKKDDPAALGEETDTPRKRRKHPIARKSYSKELRSIIGVQKVNKRKKDDPAALGEETDTPRKRRTHPIARKNVSRALRYVAETGMCEELVHYWNAEKEEWLYLNPSGVHYRKIPGLLKWQEKIIQMRELKKLDNDRISRIINNRPVYQPRNTDRLEFQLQNYEEVTDLQNTDFNDYLVIN